VKRLARLVVVCAALGVAACGTRRVELPSGPGAPVPDAAAIYERATSACRGIRTLTAELGIAGRSGATKLRGRALAGFERPASMRLEGAAPFGPPAFILATSPARTVLLLPRDDRVLTGARPAEVVEALTGIRLAPDALLAVLTGCVSATPDAVAGRVYAGGWTAIDLGGDATAFLKPDRTGALAIAAARVEGLTIEFDERVNGLPRRIRIWAESPVRTDLAVSVSQLETNVPLDADVFEVNVPGDARPISLEELRDAGPLGASGRSSSR
jgi:hypothetical protein